MLGFEIAVKAEELLPLDDGESGIYGVHVSASKG
jgi:hypothetical protein